MEYLGIGFCLIASAVLYKKTRGLESAEAGQGWFEFTAVALFGVFFASIGALGLIFGISSIFPGVHGSIVLFVALYYLLVQARILNIALTTDEGLAFVRKKNTNIVQISRMAFSVGVFPTKGPFLLLIHTCQIFLLLIIAIFVKGVLW
jgi:hypothetical protein